MFEHPFHMLIQYVASK